MLYKLALKSKEVDGKLYGILNATEILPRFYVGPISLDDSGLGYEILDDSHRRYYSTYPEAHNAFHREIRNLEVPKVSVLISFTCPHCGQSTSVLSRYLDVETEESEFRYDHSETKLCLECDCGGRIQVAV